MDGPAPLQTILSHITQSLIISYDNHADSNQVIYTCKHDLVQMSMTWTDATFCMTATTFLQPTSTPNNIVRLDRRWFGTRNTHTNLSWWRFTTSPIDLPCLPSTLPLNYALLIPCSQNARAIPSRHPWSNTSNLRISSILNDLVSHPQNRTERTVAQ